MNRLIQELIWFIEEQVRSVVIASGAGGARFEFVGAPMKILEEILSYFLEKGGISVVVNGENRIVPVYLLCDDNINPDGFDGGRCNIAHLTNVRNSSCQYFLALIPLQKLENKSISSSTTQIGVPQRGRQEWGQHHLVRNFINKALGLKRCDPEVYDDCVTLVLNDAEALDEHLNDRAWQWETLNVFFSTGNPRNQQHDEVIAACGLPRTVPGRSTFSRAQQVIKKIAEKMVSKGLQNFFEQLIESLEDIFSSQQGKVESIRSALEDCKAHLLRQNILAPQFEQAPRIYYTPYRAIGLASELPEWWKMLTVEVWEQLLDDDITDDPEEELNVRLENALFNPTKGHPHVVQDIPSFIVKEKSNGQLPGKIIVGRGIGKRTPVNIGEIETCITARWEDTSLPAHETNLRYVFSAPNEGLRDSIIRLVSLEHFVPGIVIDTGLAKKLTLLKKAKGSTSRKAIWECDITLLGKDIQHHFFVYFSKNIKFLDKIKYCDTGGKQLLEEQFQSERAGKNQVVLTLDEEGYIELIGTVGDSGKEFIIRAMIHLEDVETTGVGSWFDKDINMHCANTSNFATYVVNATWSRSQQLTQWILDNQDSYYPLVMGYDYRENWKNPQWDSWPVMSRYSFSNDIRPRKENFVPPENLLACREYLRKLVNGEEGGVIELVNLGELAEDPNHLEKVIEYMLAYSEWLTKDPDNALWFDTIAIIRPETTGSVLSQRPDAILLNPMHPVRLGWQFLAQHVLYSSLVRKKYCPAAGILDPCSTPDCMMLPCWTAGQTVHPVPFVSMKSNSDYWMVLWNGSAIDTIGDKKIGQFFDEDFGIKLDGIAAGFTMSQVDRTLNDITMIRSARACLKVCLIDDTLGSSACTEGIIRWSTENLGDEDQWRNAGARSLEIYDARNDLQWPSPRQVANLTSDTQAAVRWFNRGMTGGDAIDLSIINHLGSMNPELAQHDIPSAIGHGTLIRQRIRRLLPTQSGSHFISESRKSPRKEKEGNTLPQVLEYLSWQLENTCAGIDSYVFAPKMIKIQENLKASRYCAISSSIVDPSCFFEADQNAYLWDYDMPTYSHRPGSNNGYYLIASETPAILQAVCSNLSKIAPGGCQLRDDVIRPILREISGRGFPTLKRLVTQGATSTGEIGLLVGLKILQNQRLGSETLFPLSGDKHVNLLIPVDPFKDMIIGLKRKLGMSGSRPDILAVSIYYHQQQISVKFTPMEVKHRSGSLVESERKAALGQASDFSTFLVNMETLADVEQIWKIAMDNLLVTMIDFGFRTASAVRGTGQSKEWAEIHSVVLQELMSGTAEKEIDRRGRLIVVDQSNSTVLDLDNDSFKETLLIQAADAYQIITSENTEIIQKIKETLDSWGLLANPKVFTKQGPGETEKREEENRGTEIQITPPTLPCEERPVISEVAQGLGNAGVNGESPRATGIYFPVGKDVTSPFQDPEVYFHPSNTQLNQLNIGIVGDLGTGKTQLTKSIVFRFVNSEKDNRGIRPKFLIFDYKGDYVDQEFIDSVGGQVIKPRRIPLNLFDISSKDAVANPVMDTISFFNDIMGKIYKVDRPNQQYVLKEAIKECYNAFHIGSGVYPTIYDVHDAYKAKIDGKVDSTLSTLSNIVDRELFEHEVSGVKPFKDFFNRVTVIDLKSLGQDDDAKNMLVVIFLHLFYDHMLKIEKKAPIGEDTKLRAIDSMLLVDEANSIMKYNFDVLHNILLQGREFGVGVLLASQYLSHFRTPQNNYAEPLLTWFIHKVPNISKRDLENIGLTEVDTDVIERIKSLAIHECLYKSFDTRRKGTFIYGYPFYKVVKKGI